MRLTGDVDMQSYTQQFIFRSGWQTDISFCNNKDKRRSVVRHSEVSQRTLGVRSNLTDDAGSRGQSKKVAFEIHSSDLRNVSRQCPA